MFNGLKEGSILYVLRKGDKDNAPVLRICQVTKKSNPVTESGLPPIQYGMGMQQVTFVDVEAKFEDEIYKFPKLNSNENVRFYQENNTLVSDNPDAVIVELDSLYRMSRQILDSVPYHQKVVDMHEELICMLNPKFAKEKEQEQKIGALETKITGMEGTLMNIQDMLSKALNGNSSKTK